VSLDREERGRLVAELLIQRIKQERADGPCQLFIRPRLVVRGSTAAPPAEQALGSRARNGHEEGSIRN
jgi:DNA-binding LacI/PurR family transcriptional regulator